jgi:hypothetical protein
LEFKPYTRWSSSSAQDRNPSPIKRHRPMSHDERFPIAAHALKLAHRHAESNHHAPHWAALEHHRASAHLGCLTSMSKDPHRELPLTPDCEAEAPLLQAFLEAAPITVSPLVRIPMPPLHFALLPVEVHAPGQLGRLPPASPDGGAVVHCFAPPLPKGINPMSSNH